MTTFRNRSMNNSDTGIGGEKTKKRKLNPTDEESDHLDVNELIVHSRRRVLSSQLLTTNSKVRGLPQITIYPLHLRASVIEEIIKTERDYVKNLKDVIEGYLQKCRQRSDMFTKGQIECIFGNIEELYEFQCEFLASLEASFLPDNVDRSEIGFCFSSHKKKFVDFYSEFCVQQNQSTTEFFKLKKFPKFSQFFEACRNWQKMTEISLDGFLIQPVQKICKYPLFLQQLLKFTPENHPDFQNVKIAYDVMKNVAATVNEHIKRRECLEKIARWQETIENWEGENLVEKSSQLIHYGDLTVKLSTKSNRTDDLTFFLFDHQIIFCRRDLLKRAIYSYKGRFLLDQVQIVDSEVNDVTPIKKHSWLLVHRDQVIFATFLSKNLDEKIVWMDAFKSEEKLRQTDIDSGFTISIKDRMAAIQLARTPRVGKEKRLKTEDALKDLTPQVVDKCKSFLRLRTRQSSPASGTTSRTIPFAFKMPLFGNIRK